MSVVTETLALFGGLDSLAVAGAVATAAVRGARPAQHAAPAVLQPTAEAVPAVPGPRNPDLSERAKTQPRGARGRFAGPAEIPPSTA